MKYLLQGGESEKRFQHILSLTQITSDPIRDALYDYYVTGHSESVAAARNGVKKGNLSRNKDIMEEKAATVEAVKDIDWEKHRDALAAALKRIEELEALLS